jgi:hypothetical protein
MASASTADGALRADAARLAAIIGVAAVVLWALLILERFGAPAMSIAQHGFDAATPRDLARRLIDIAPDVAYLVALQSIRGALARFAQGEFFAPTVVRMLARVGVLLATGALMTTFVVPLIERALGASPGYWIALDVSGLVLGALGLALFVIARVLRRAAAIESELAEIF